VVRPVHDWFPADCTLPDLLDARTLLAACA
jgi:hypothetical protein